MINISKWNNLWFYSKKNRKYISNFDFHLKKERKRVRVFYNLSV